jgi:hypothetical protein
LSESAFAGTDLTVEEDKLRVFLVTRNGIPDRRFAHRRLSEGKAPWQRSAYVGESRVSGIDSNLFCSASFQNGMPSDKAN